MSGDLGIWIAAVGTAATALAAILALCKYRGEVRNKDILRWQKTTIQAIFQAANYELSFEDMQLRYRSQAAGHMRKRLGDEDISEENLRQVLIDLCRDNVIVQKGNDRYSLTTYLSEMEAMHDLQMVFFEAQLEVLGSQSESVKKLLAQNEKMVSAVGAK